ncbi:Heavy metal RND efflux outer membrane protein, CzcC family [hydrothermal vent metagenome]|uniref:Heavy metal RND efflux outer membrane protein, CzcC family n=1 Tax=hydrothermal vent metagenome TaxID=652676 RepID=A0A3B0W7X3_9ZZZZ
MSFSSVVSPIRCQSIQIIFVVLFFTLPIVSTAETTLSLDKTINIAQQNDPWLAGNTFTQESIDSMSVAVGSLPDPKVSVALANLPIDDFDFGAEGMTQVKVGVSQMFPRGSTLALKRKQLQLQSSQFPFQRQDRRAKIVVTVTHLWLDAYKAQESIALIEKDRELFEQLADVAQASYSAALGRTRQQDIIRAQLELTRLDDRLTMLNQKREMSLQKLSQWLSSYFLDNYSNGDSSTAINFTNGIRLDTQLPSRELLNSFLYDHNNTTSANEIFEYLSRHPAVLALKQKIATTDTGIDLAKQKYKPAWGVNASYGYRGETPAGINRSDFLSLGVSFDVPLFTKNRQDKELESAVAKSAAVQTQEWLLLRKFIASFETAKAQLYRLNERQALYQQQLLPQMHEQAEASLTAYTNDDGDFAEVVRSRIAELNAEIDALSIAVDRQKTITQLNYFFTNNQEKPINIDQQGEQK